MDYAIWLEREQAKARNTTLSELDYFKRLAFIKYQALEILKCDLQGLVHDIKCPEKEQNGSETARSIRG